MKNVSRKLLNAIRAVGGKVEKTGYNNFSKYAYITESDVNEAILPALLAEGLLLTTSIESLVETPSGPDSKNRFATVHLNHKIIDTESGEVLELKSAGTAADTLDKAIYKAYTGSCKYFMLKTFLISGDDTDPENDSTAKPVAPPPKVVATKAPAPKVAAPVTKPPVVTAPASKAPVLDTPAPKANVAKPNFSFNKPNTTKKPPPDFGAKRLDPATIIEAATANQEATFDDIEF